MKKLFTTVLTAVFFGCFLVKAQTTSSNTSVIQPVPIATTPANISQFEVRGRLITQNAFVGTGVIPTNQQTGDFGTAARWNSMGSLNAGSQILNGFRTQTNGKGLTIGYSVVGTTVSNPTIQWIGNSTAAGVLPGNLEFKFALDPGSPGLPATDAAIFTMAPSPSITIPSFSYATRGTLVGQLQSGTLGSFGIGDTWSAIGPVNTSSFNTYGNRHQYAGRTINSALIEDNTSNIIKAVMDFGSTASVGSTIFQFRAFTDPTSPSSIKNVWQSSNRYNNMVLGIQDYSATNNANFLLSVFDGVAPFASSTALSFVQKAGLYVTGDGLDQNNAGNRLNSYAAVVGDITGVNLVGSANTKYAILGIATGIGTAPPGSVNNAGYFVGDLSYTGSLILVSDQKFKKEINAEENIMPKLMQLQPKNYFFDIEKYSNYSVPKLAISVSAAKIFCPALMVVSMIDLRVTKSSAPLGVLN